MRHGRNDAALRARLKKLAERYPRYGCPTLHDMLRAEGLVQNLKRAYRIYREEGLQVYDSAVRVALEDGHISSLQHRVLNGVLRSMGINGATAKRMEEDAIAAQA